MLSCASGPGTVSFANQQARLTSATFSASGFYTLRLTANDSEFSSSDDVVVRVFSTNQAPSVNAGADLTVSTPINTVTLTGTVSDDGQPSNVPLIVTWMQVSGPATVKFSNAAVASTAATFTAQGSMCCG